MSLQKRILIVDDEANVRMVFRTTLETVGHEVAEADDGAAAILLARKAPFDLILLDLKMPGTDGMETLKRLRDSGDPTPVVVVTAHGGVAEAVAAVKLGAIDFLPKPVSPTSLREVVASAVASAVLSRTSARATSAENAPGRSSASPAAPPEAAAGRGGCATSPPEAPRDRSAVASLRGRPQAHPAGDGPARVRRRRVLPARRRCPEPRRGGGRGPARGPPGPQKESCGLLVPRLGDLMR